MFLFRVFSVSVAVTLSLFTVAVAGAQTITRVAIGPFENRSGIAEDDWLGQGLAESVATDVRANGLVVVDLRGLLFRDTSEQVEDRVETVALTEARARGAAWLVMGSYQRVTDQVRIIVRFVHVETGIVARRANIDGVIGRLFELQDEIAPILVDVISAGVNRNASRQVAAIDARGGTLPTNAQQRPMPRGGLAARPAGDVPTTIIQPTSEPPRIDGRLDDPVWASATHITDFVQIAPVAGAPGTEATEVWMAYDRDNLYFAFYAHYTDPSIIRINRTDRDEALGDDQMAVLFDPFLDQQRAYQFEVNGYGVQGDSLVNADGTGRSRGSNSMSMVTSSLGASYWQRNSGSGMSMSGTFGIRGDSSWNALFETAGELVEDGWTAEMAIPFKSLRYPARAEGESHRWGFQITRRIRGRSQAQSWSPISRDIQGNLTQFGILEGLEELSQSRNLEVLPEVTGLSAGSLDRGTGGYDDADPEGDFGVGFKYGITPNLTADLTYNPDFSQIEADRPQIETNQRFSLFYPEQRPFFLEGQEIFQVSTPMTLLNTRTIVDPRFGGKLTGKVGDTTLGVIVADDEAPGYLAEGTDARRGTSAQTVVGRVRRDFYTESYLGAVMTSREFGQDYNRVGGGDGRFRLGQTHRLSFLALGSSTQNETEGTLSGPAVEVDLTRQGRNLGYSASYGSIDPEFRAESGFIPRVDLQQASGTLSYRWWPESTLMTWGPSFTYFRLYDHAGQLQDEEILGQTSFQFRNNISVTTTVSRDLERYREVDFRKTKYGLFGVISGRTLSVYGSYNGGDGILFGDNPYLGRTNTGVFNVSLRPHARMRVEFNNIFSRFLNPLDGSEVFDVRIYRTRTTFQFTSRFLLRHIMEHNTQAVTLGNNLLLTYRINAGTVMFLGYDDRYQRGTQIDNVLFPMRALQRTNHAIFTKVSYLFRY